MKFCRKHSNNCGVKIIPGWGGIKLVIGSDLTDVALCDVFGICDIELLLTL